MIIIISIYREGKVRLRKVKVKTLGLIPKGSDPESTCLFIVILPANSNIMDFKVPQTSASHSTILYLTSVICKM